MNASDIERRFFEATNEARLAHGVPALLWHNELAEVARAHSRDMSDNDHPSHTGSDGSTLADRISRLNIVNSGIGENIGAGTHPADEIVGFIIESWLNSPAHRAVLLHPSLTHIGMGVVQNTGDSEFNFYITQNFIRYP
jgi:uncharacterized protein YkwD